MSKSSLFRIDIAPLTPLPLTRSPLFSYRYERALPLGSLVEVPFGKRLLKGIVFACAPLPGRAPLWLKPINRTIFPAWLNPTQQTLAQFISSKYFSSLGNTLKHFVFPLPKKKLDENIPQIHTPPARTRAKYSKQERCIEMQTDQALWTWLEKKIKRQLSQSGSLLILVPDLLLAHTLEQKFCASLGAEIDTLTSRLTPKQLLATWQRIRTGQAKIILGTRQMLFAPLTNVREIIVLFPEERLSYKQWDMTPFYEASAIARALAQTTGAELTWLTTSLGLEEQYHFPKIAKHTLSPPIIIDRRKDGKGARSKAFAKELEKMLRELKEGSKVLLLAKERGVAGVLVCQNCRTTARCPTCQHILAEQASGHLRCLACGYMSPFFPKCHTCGHMTFKSFSFGTVRVEREYERLFPQKRLLRIDRDALATRSAWTKILKQLSEGAFDVLITTHEIGTLLPLPPLDLAVMLEGDHGLSFAQFDSEERLMLQIKRVTAKLKPGAHLIVQTFTPEEQVWCESTTSNLKTFFETLLDERKLLGYPPTAAMIQIAPARGSLLTASEMQSIHDRLAKILEPFQGFVLTPLFGGKTKRRGIQMSFVLKYPSKTVLPEPLITFLNRESRHLTIDVHPLHT